VRRHELTAEFSGSMFLVTAAISPIILFTEVLESHIGIALIANAIAVAFVLGTLIEMFAPVSGAHFNPVVTFVMLIDKKITALKAAAYITVQIIGGVLGTVLTHLMFYNETGGFIFVSENTRTVYFSEVIGTFILVFAILLLVKVKSNKLSIFVGLLVGGQIMSTSSTMFANPQVTIARIFTNSASGIRPFDAMIFIAMQFIGGLFAYAVYRFMFPKSNKEDFL
jgi:glycerol uptake facilitator-like aquaporin